MKRLTIVLLLFLLVGCATKEPEPIDPRYSNIDISDIYIAKQNGTSQSELKAMYNALDAKRRANKTDDEKTQDTIEHIVRTVVRAAGGAGAVVIQH